MLFCYIIFNFVIILKPYLKYVVSSFLSYFNASNIITFIYLFLKLRVGGFEF